MARSILFILVSTFVIGACAPAVERSVFPEPKIDFGPRHEDVDLGFDSGSKSDVALYSVERSHLQWPGHVATASVLRFSEDMVALGDALARPGLAAVGEEIANALISAPGVSAKTQFEMGPYVSAATGETKADSLAYVESVLTSLLNDAALVVIHIRRSKEIYPWPRGRRSAERSIAEAGRFLNWFSARLEASSIDPRITAEIRSSARDRKSVV